MAPLLSKENSIPAGGSRISYIPEELRDEILIRVPVKSVIRFKLVCKTWRSVLNSRKFISLYGRRKSRWKFKLSSSVHCGTDKADLYKLAPRLSNTTGEERSKRIIKVLGPLSNGIYCITSLLYYESKAFSILAAKIALCNPATNDFKFTNPFPREFHELLSAAERRQCQVHFGFGFGSVVDESDYKVVVLINYGESSSSFLSLVYNVQRHEWTKIVDYEEGKKNVGERKATDAFNGMKGRRMIQISPCIEVCPQRLLRGCWHWAAIAQDDVLSFNFADEAFKLIAGPPPPAIIDDIDENIFQISAPLVLRDHLAVIRSFSTFLPLCVEIDVWMMMEYGVEESWRRIYKINPNLSVKLRGLCGIDHYSPPRDESEESGPGIHIQRLFFKDVNKDIISFDDAGHTLHNLPNSTNIINWNTPGISSYIETLEPLSSEY